ncbi:MAG: lipid A export permease/ATP-binding protein MsbA [Betaproteobacteria bacterium]|nr:lipid A export permease/ATP-binding protein MsbA [Betaproteobacteria bacterium]
MTGSQLYRRLLRYVAPYRKQFAIAILATIVVALTEPALPILLKPLFDGVFVERDAAMIRWMPLMIIGLFLVRGLAEYTSNYCMAWVGNRVVMDLRARMFAKLLELPAPYYDEQASGNLISKLTYDVTQVTAAATNVLVVVFKDTVAIIGLLAWMFWLNWKLTLLALGMAPLLILIVRLMSVRLRTTSRSAQTAVGDVTQVIQEAIEGQKVVKLYAGQNYEAQRFEVQTNRVRRFLMKQASAAAAGGPVVQLVAASALAAMIFFALRDANGVTVGGFVSFLTAMMMLTGPLKHITNINEPLQRGLAAAESVFALLDQPGEKNDGKLRLERARGELQFENVTLRYEGAERPALDNINLTIAPGETVALVGASGAGKTTVANLVPCFYRPTTGRVLLDGHDIAQVELASLRSNIALVSQDVVLFNDTVAANIAYGAMKDVDQARIKAAADAAHATEYIEQMQEGFDTLVGENGVKLSGGQRQRLAIARALLKNAPVLVLDEATSALDTESERHVQAALETLMKGRTTLVIAHRLSTVENADRIVVLDKGRIVEVGKHRELLAQGRTYAKLYQIQFSSETPANA